MNILVIHGSMRKGKTYSLTKEIVNRLSSKPDVEIIEFSVADLNLPFCCSCHVCFAKGEEHCPHFGIVRALRDALINCDGVILTGTTYMWAMNAAMKNLLDHFAYMFHRPVLFGKKGMVVATSKGTGEKNVAKYLKTVLGQWGINKAVVVTQNEKTHRMQTNGVGLSVQEAAQIDKAISKFYKTLASNQQISPGLKSIVVHNAFRAQSLSNYSESERDTQHWSREEFRDKAYPAKAGAIKYLIGTMVYNLAKNLTDALGRSLERRVNP